MFAKGVEKRRERDVRRVAKRDKKREEGWMRGRERKRDRGRDRDKKRDRDKEREREEERRIRSKETKQLEEKSVEIITIIDRKKASSSSIVHPSL